MLRNIKAASENFIATAFIWKSAAALLGVPYLYSKLLSIPPLVSACCAAGAGTQAQTKLAIDTLEINFEDGYYFMPFSHKKIVSWVN